MAYVRRKKGGQKLSDLSKRRRQTPAKSKVGKLKPMVIEPSLSKLRVSKGQAKGKGGSALKALSKTKAAAKKAVSKPMAKTRSQAARNVAAGSKARTPSAATRRQARANIARADKKRATPPSFPARGGKGREAFPQSLISYAKENPVETALTFTPGGVGAGVKIASWLKNLSKAAKPLVQGVRGVATKSKPKPTGGGTPRKPSGPGSKTPKKPTGPGSRTTRRSSSAESPNKKVQRQKKREAKKTERRERVDSGSVRMGIQKRGAALARGRKTQAQKRADRQRRKRYNL